MPILTKIAQAVKTSAGSLQSDRATGDFLRDKKEYAGAAKAYEAHLRENPQDFDIWVQLGNCAKEARNYALSKAAYDAALQLDDQNADLHLQRGHLFKLIGRKAEARSSYLKSASLATNNKAALFEIDQLGAQDDEDFRLPLCSFDMIAATSLDELRDALRGRSLEDDPFILYDKIINQ